MKLTKQLLKTLLFLFACGSILSTVTLLYEKVGLFNLATICLYAEFTIPKKSTAFGFPLAFLTRTDWVRMIGCGPILGEFSSYFFCPFGFMGDTTFYALIISPLFLLIRHRMTKKKNSLPSDEAETSKILIASTTSIAQ